MLLQPGPRRRRPAPRLQGVESPLCAPAPGPTPAPHAPEPPAPHTTSWLPVHVHTRTDTHTASGHLGSPAHSPELHFQGRLSWQGHFRGRLGWRGNRGDGAGTRLSAEPSQPRSDSEPQPSQTCRAGVSQLPGAEAGEGQRDTGLRPTPPCWPRSPAISSTSLPSANSARRRQPRPSSGPLWLRESSPATARSPGRLADPAPVALPGLWAPSALGAQSTGRKTPLGHPRHTPRAWHKPPQESLGFWAPTRVGVQTHSSERTQGPQAVRGRGWETRGTAPIWGATELGPLLTEAPDGEEKAQGARPAGPGMSLRQGVHTRVPGGPWHSEPREPQQPRHMSRAVLSCARHPGPGGWGG